MRVCFKRAFWGVVLFFAGGLAILSHVRAEATANASSEFLYSAYSKTISMDFKDAQLIDVLKILSQQSGLNFIGSQEVANKKVTLYLNNVPVEEALTRILTANGLTYEIEPGNDIFIVKPLDRPIKNTLTRVYRLKYATVASSKLNQTISITSNDSKSGSAESTTTTTQNTTAGIVAAVKSVLSSSGTMVEDPRTNSLIITDLPTQFPIIEQTIARLDVPIPQILIEVEMLDVSKNTADKIGVKYGDTPLAFKGAKRSILYPWNQNRLLAKGFSFSTEYEVGTVDASGLTAILQFLRTQTDTKNLARPRILTLNNETAQIKISTNEAIGIANTTNSSQSTATSTLQAERVETGVFLKVTPQADLLNREITLAISPKVIQARTGGTFQGQTFKDPEERGANAILKVKDGETLIIGGLVRTDHSSVVTKIPVLGDIPFIGGAFRHKDSTDVERELIIFITPHILAEQSGPAIAKASFQPVSREQDTPPLRKEEIEKALATMENQQFLK